MSVIFTTHAYSHWYKYYKLHVIFLQWYVPVEIITVKPCRYNISIFSYCDHFTSLTCVD